MIFMMKHQWLNEHCCKKHKGVLSVGMDGINKVFSLLPL
jgi:hypothetical protein